MTSLRARWRHVWLSFVALACWLTVGLVAVELLWMSQAEPDEPETLLQSALSALGMAGFVSLVAVAAPTLLTGRSSSVRDVALGVAVILVASAFSHPLRVEAGPVAILGDMLLTAPFAVIVMIAAVATVLAWKRLWPFCLRTRRGEPRPE